MEKYLQLGGDNYNLLLNKSDYIDTLELNNSKLYTINDIKNNDIELDVILLPKDKIIYFYLKK
jgi:hypothetical protein